MAPAQGWRAQIEKCIPIAEKLAFNLHALFLSLSHPLIPSLPPSHSLILSLRHSLALTCGAGLSLTPQLQAGHS